MDLTRRYSLNDQIRCVDREIAMRERLYPKYVNSGKWTQQKADQELGCMIEVLRTLRNLLPK